MQQHLAALGGGQVFQDRGQEFVHDDLGGLQTFAAAAGLAVYAHADFHFVGADVEGRAACCGDSATGEGHAHARRGCVHTVTQRLALCERHALFCASTHHFFYDDGAGYAAAPRGVGGVFHGHIVVDEHGGVFNLQHFAGDLEIHGVAGVVLYDKQHPLVHVHGMGGGQHLVRGG